MTSKGEVVVTDFNNRRLQLLSPRAARAGSSCGAFKPTDVVTTLAATGATPFIAPTCAVPDGNTLLVPRVRIEPTARQHQSSASVAEESKARQPWVRCPLAYVRCVGLEERRRVVKGLHAALDDNL